MPKLKLLRDAYKPKESEIRKEIQRYLDAKGIYNWRQWQGQFSVRGCPDIIGILPAGGRILGIEVKRPGNQPTIAQLAFMEAIRKSGGVAFVATSIEDVESQLEVVRDK
jgi:hypothetical protein